VIAASRLATSFALTAAFAATPCHGQQQLLPPEQAFRIQSTQIDPSAVVFNFSMRPGYVLYHDRFSFSGGDIERVELPAPESKFDPILGRSIQFYRGTVSAKVVLRPTSNRSILTAAAQGCAQEIGVCYPPVSAAHRLP
jgi:thiol:disulfide interchange protein DsbD